MIRTFNQYKSDKKNSLIQVIGLVLGIVTCIFVAHYAFYEYSFDRFNKDANSIYRTSGTEGKLLALLAEKHLSHVEKAARLHPCYRGVTIVSGENSLHETNAYFGDGSLFSILDFTVVKGEIEESLKRKNQMAVSESYAEKLFGADNPVGQTVIVNGSYENNESYTVAGVFKDIPKNSHLRFDVLFSIENILTHRMYTQDLPWRWSNFFTYFKTTHPVNAELLGNDLYVLAQNNGRQRKNNEAEKLTVQLLTDIHFNGQSNFMDNNLTSRDVLIRVFTALLIMIIAWLNFINIGFGSALKNKMVYSVKKVLGASSQSIWAELFQKSFASSMLALITAVVLFFVFGFALKETVIMPEVAMPRTWHLGLWAMIFTLQIIGALLVSLAMYGLIGHQKFCSSITGSTKTNRPDHLVWKILFVLQFGASIVLICFAFFASKQVHGLMSIDKGINTSQVLAIRSPYYSDGGDIGSDRKAFEQEALKIPGIIMASSASYIPGSSIASNMPTRLAGQNEDANISCMMNFVDYDYIPLLEQNLLAGRNFSKGYSTDATGIIINETLCRAYGFDTPDEAVGKGILWVSRNVNRKIIGVMEDSHHLSADVPLQPTMFHFWGNANGYVMLKVNVRNPDETIKSLKQLWNKIHHANTFDYLWLDQHYKRQYDKWVQLVQIIKILSFIAIFIACIGLFGLSSMLLDQRTKEIGIRKVNGARISEVLVMLNKDFVKWVIIAFVIATPIAYYAMHKWLENFAYKTELSWWIFALAGLLALGIALLTVSWQSWKAATRNPVEALRYE
jgi:putative ABC transport system permease protein